jgi:hypothetical protein
VPASEVKMALRIPIYMIKEEKPNVEESERWILDRLEKATDDVLSRSKRI